MLSMLKNQQVDFNQDCWLKKSEVYRTPLGWAAQHNRSGIIKTLLENVSEIDVNQGNRLKETPLYIAAQHGNLESVHVLCEAEKINLNEVSRDGQTALMVAAQYADDEQHRAIAFHLINCGASTDQKDDAGKTYLDYAPASVRSIFDTAQKVQSVRHILEAEQAQKEEDAKQQQEMETKKLQEKQEEAREGPEEDPNAYKKRLQRELDDMEQFIRDKRN